MNFLASLFQASRTSCLLLIIGSACSRADLLANGLECPQDARAFTPRLVDSVVLQEGSATFLGNPAMTFTATPDGSLFIPDLELNRVSAFTGRGEVRGQLGRSGGGPGEFRAVGTFGVARDTLLVQSDGGGARLNFYDSRSLVYLGQIAYEGYFSWISPARDGFLVGLLGSYGVAFLSGNRIAAALEGTQVAPLRSDKIDRPLEYRNYPLLNSWQDVKVVENGEGLLTIFGGTDYLLSRDSLGAIDTIPVPICQRRGAPKARLDRWFTHPPGTSAEARAARDATDNSISALLGLWRRPSGEFLIWFQDPTFEQDGRIFKGVAYLTLLSADLRRECIDARFEAPGTDRTRLTVSADSVFVLDQVSTDINSGAVRTVVRKYLLDLSSCRWVQVQHR